MKRLQWILLSTLIILTIFIIILKIYGYPYLITPGSKGGHREMICYYFGEKNDSFLTTDDIIKEKIECNQDSDCYHARLICNIEKHKCIDNSDNNTGGIYKNSSLNKEKCESIGAEWISMTTWSEP